MKRRSVILAAAALPLAGSALAEPFSVDIFVPAEKDFGLGWLRAEGRKARSRSSKSGDSWLHVFVEMPHHGPSLKDLPGFVSVSEYSPTVPLLHGSELGAVEIFRFYPYWQL